MTDQHDREQVELELRTLRSGTGTNDRVSLNPPDRQIITGTLGSRRRPSSVSRQTAPTLDLFEKQRQNTLADNDVFEEEERDQNQVSGQDEYFARQDASRSRNTTHVPGTPSEPNTTAPPTRAASLDDLNPSQGEPAAPILQSRPVEIPNAVAEILFVLICSTGQLLFGFLSGGVAGLQSVLVHRLEIEVSQTPWLLGSFLLANGLSVIVSGPLADLMRPKYLMCGAFGWQAIAHIVGTFSMGNKYLFFMVRAAQGLTVGVLVSSSISILGRVYKPGRRKTRVFSVMAAMSPLGFWLGTLQGGALSKDPKWIFASDAILSALCFAAGVYAIPNIRPALEGLSFRSFDYVGSTLAVFGCAMIVAGLTQGPSAEWKHYTIVLVVLGLIALVSFFFVERRVQRPLLPPALWKIPGFTALIIAYFLGFGGFFAWQFYAVTFWIEIQHTTPLFVALYLIPNAVFGVLATFIVSRIAHLVAGHWILATSMVAFALGPVFFLPQTANTNYFALSMPGIGLATFGPVSFYNVRIRRYTKSY